MSLVVVTCSRCQKKVDSLKDKAAGMTGGYYEVHEGYWSRFSNAGEYYLCDACMWADERYREVFGVHSER